MRHPSSLADPLISQDSSPQSVSPDFNSARPSHIRYTASARPRKVSGVFIDLLIVHYQRHSRESIGIRQLETAQEPITRLVAQTLQMGRVENESRDG